MLQWGVNLEDVRMKVSSLWDQSSGFIAMTMSVRKDGGGLVLVGRGVVAVATAVEGRCNSTLPVVSDGSVDGCLAAGDVAAVDVAGWLPRWP